MSETSLDQLSNSLYSVLITMTWGDPGSPHVARFCKWTEDLIVNGLTYKAEPSLHITENEQQGGTDDAPLDITARYRFEPFLTMARMEIMAKVKVLIAFVAVGDDSTYHEWFYGTISLTTVSPQGQSGLITCRVAGIKARLVTLLGIPITTTCASAHLGDAMCKFDVASRVRTGIITAIDPFFADLIRTDLSGGLGNLNWKFGYVEIDGLRINIRASLEEGSFQLRENPPVAWVGQSAVFTPGCDRQILTCRTIYNNEVNFSGAGFAMPNFNPIFQLG